MLVYATSDELADHVAEIPDNADQLLKRASIMVRNATRFDLYDTLPSGMPEDLDVIDAFREATCAQVAEWVANDVDPVAGEAGVQAGVASSSIAGGSVSYDLSHAELARASVGKLSSYALDILRAEGLAGPGVATW